MPIDQLTEKERAEIARQKRRAAVRWYVLYVHSGHERKVLELLKKKEKIEEPYIPMQNEKRKYSDRVVTKARLVAPGLVFVRMALVNQSEVYVNSHITGFMFSKSLHEPEHIPDWQMQQFRAIVDAEEHISMVTPMQGDTVRIMRGRFEGFVGQMIFDGTAKKFQIRIGEQAFVITVNAEDVVKVPAESRSEIPDERYR